MLTDPGFPNGPINDIEDVATHEQTIAQELAVAHDDPDWGECQLPGHPIRYPDYEDEPVVRSPAPGLGEHTEEFFADVVDEQSTLDEWAVGGPFRD